MAFAASVLFLAYNQEALVADAAASVLRQEGEPIEIVLSDDASSDGTFAVMQRLADAYRGPHRVSARRNEHNQGIGRHLSTLVDCTEGELLFVAAGDDISEPTRVAEVLSAWRAAGCKADLVATPMTGMSPDGQLGAVIEVDDLAQWRSVDDWGRKRPYVVGAAHAWTRRLFQRFGPLSADIAYEDQVMAFRAICSGGGITVPRPLVRYRSGGTSARSSQRDPAERLQRLHTQSRRHLAELDQLRRDAAIAGQGPAVDMILRPELARQRFLADLLAAPAGPAFLKSVFSTRDPVPLSWRLRKSWSVGRLRQQTGR